MNYRDTEPGSGRRRVAGRHSAPAILAALLSVGLHVAMVMTLGDVPLGLRVVPQRQGRARQSRQPIKVGRLEEKPPPKETDRPRTDGSSRGVSVVGVDTVDQAARLGLTPDMVVMAPPTGAGRPLAGDDSSLSSPSAAPQRDAWSPRRDILIIESRVAADEIRGVKRWTVPRVERAARAPDVANPLDPRVTGAPTGLPSTDAGTGTMLDPRIMARLPDGRTGGEKPPVNVGETGATNGVDLFREDPEDVTPYQPIEKLLEASVTTYQPFGDFKYGYFRVEINRAGAEVLPVVPKDVILVQDCSASMAEQRLYFCRQGLTNCLTLLGPEDRFNIVSFRDRSQMCFEAWQSPTPQSLLAAKAFIVNMTSFGSTDIFFSIKNLASLKRTPGRPIVAFLLTDGRSTTGLTRSSDIIGEFSKLNDGAISVFAMGTIQLADTYLLDLLTYCNRGNARIAQGGRWGIPDEMTKVMREVSRPVLADMTCRFAEGLGCEVYPVQTSNLYLDQTFVLVGRYPRKQERIVFQVKGAAGKRKCDMVFDLALDKDTRRRDKSIREDWARQKIYHLIGEFARQPTETLLSEMKKTSKSYRIKIPYEGRLSSDSGRD